jgi:hypothetical protein
VRTPRRSQRSFWRAASVTTRMLREYAVLTTAGIWTRRTFSPVRPLGSSMPKLCFALGCVFHPHITSFQPQTASWFASRAVIRRTYPRSYLQKRLQMQVLMAQCSTRGTSVATCRLSSTRKTATQTVLWLSVAVNPRKSKCVYTGAHFSILTLKSTQHREDSRQSGAPRHDGVLQGGRCPRYTFSVAGFYSKEQVRIGVVSCSPNYSQRK